MTMVQTDAPNIVLKGLSKSFSENHDQGSYVLENVDLTINRGEFYILLGPSGCGKSTLLNILGHNQKFPNEISGGMKQRVQLARVLANDPQILLMDEPFGALDAMTRRTMQKELIRIWTETNKTVIFVTHDIQEALMLGQRIGIMSVGPSSKIIHSYQIDMPYPREITSPDFNEYYKVVQSHFD